MSEKCVQNGESQEQQINNPVWGNYYIVVSMDLKLVLNSHYTLKTDETFWTFKSTNTSPKSSHVSHPNSPLHVPSCDIPLVLAQNPHPLYHPCLITPTCTSTNI